ncbi:MAG: hypothetical protein ACRES7_06545, partial [Gammaproteobacteria bacterium]
LYMTPRYQVIADRLAPEYLFAEYPQLLRAGQLWPGNRDWAAFDLEDIATAQQTARLGVRYIETMNPALLTELTAL